VLKEQQSISSNSVPPPPLPPGGLWVDMNFNGIVCIVGGQVGVHYLPDLENNSHPPSILFKFCLLSF